MSDLFQRFQAVLLEMRLLAEGHTSSFDGKVSGGKGSSSAPRHTETLYGKYMGEGGAVERLLFQAERDLDRYKRGRESIVDKEDRDARIIADYEGWPAAKVAVFVDLSHSQVRRIREKADRRPSDGLPLT